MLILTNSILDSLKGITMKNIILIGMPASGKTTISELLAEKLDMYWYDVDVYLEEKEGKLIKEIFSLHGEDHFRELEEKYTKELANKENIIISTGGGVIKRESNIENLKKNGVIIFIDRDVEEISKEDHSDRPLLQDIKNIEKLYDERFHLYNKYADYVIKNNDSLEIAVKTIIDLWGKVKI